jgi:hypothetical protein
MQCSRGHNNKPGSQFCVVCGEQMVAVEPVQRTQNNFDRLAGLQGGGTSQPRSTPQEPVAQFSTNSPPAGQQSFAAQPKNGMGTAALVLGIIGIVTFIFWWILGPLAIIFGAVGRKRARLGVANNKVQATWGMWLGIVPVGLGILIILSGLANG